MQRTTAFVAAFAVSLGALGCSDAPKDDAADRAESPIFRPSAGGADEQSCFDRCKRAFAGCSNPCDERMRASSSPCHPRCNEKLFQCTELCRSGS